MSCRSLARNRGVRFAALLLRSDSPRGKTSFAPPESAVVRAKHPNALTLPSDDGLASRARKSCLRLPQWLQNHRCRCSFCPPLLERRRYRRYPNPAQHPNRRWLVRHLNRRFLRRYRRYWRAQYPTRRYMAQQPTRCFQRLSSCWMRHSIRRSTSWCPRS